MPVIGHALAGLTIAGLTWPRAPISATPAGWALTLVLLSYIPDLAAQPGWVFKALPIATITHSLIFAVLAALILTSPVAQVTGIDRRRAFGIGGMAIGLHDLLDIVQSPGRLPFWPLGPAIDVGRWIPTSFPGELVVFFPVFLLSTLYAIRHRGAVVLRRDWTGLLAVSVLVVAAGAVSELRDRRERELVTARALAESGHYREALEVCASAERWPSPARPGRLEYIRAMAWWGLGDRERAERAYLRSYADDPRYIWTVGDLGALYAEGDEPLEVRTRRVEPWIQILQSRFRDDPARPGLIRRIERRLQRTAPR